MADVVNYHGSFKYDTDKPEGMIQKLMDNSIAIEKFHGSVATPMDKAIQLVVDAYDTQSGAGS